MIEEFLNECKKNAFFWWGVIMWVLTTFSSFWIFNLTLQSIVEYRLYLLTLFIAMTLSMITGIHLNLESLKKYAKEVSKERAIGYTAGILICVYADVVYFLFDPYIIFSKLSSGVLPENILNFTVYIQALAQFLIIPFFYTVLVTYTKKVLKETNCVVSNRFRDNPKFLLGVISSNTIGCLISFLIH